MSPTGLEEAGVALSVATRVLNAIRKPFAAIARRLGGVDVEQEEYAIETRRLARDHDLQLCDELDECVNGVERIGPIIERGLSPDHPDAIEYGSEAPTA
jgi:hypothetical protein